MQGLTENHTLWRGLPVKRFKKKKKKKKKKILRFPEAVRIGAVKWKLNFQARLSDIMKIPWPGKYHV